MTRMTLTPEEVWFPFSESVMDWDFDFHELLLNDEPRMHAYKEAIRSTVRPGDIVVDVGTGTGILAIWALQAGATHVHAIELNETILQQARHMMATNGFETRCSFYQDVSYRVVLPERCDLMISEIIGNIGDNEDFLAILMDAKRRFLKEGGRMIPRIVTSFLTPVEAVNAHHQIKIGKCRVVNGSYNLDRLLAERGLRSHFDIYYDVVIPQSAVLGSARELRKFHFQEGEPTEYSVTLNFTVQRSGELTGFKGHFVAQLSDDVVLDISSDDISNGEVSCSWKHAYFPLQTPVAVQKGDRIAAVFSREYPDTAKNFRQIYRWEGMVLRNDTPVGSFGQGMKCSTEG